MSDLGKILWIVFMFLIILAAIGTMARSQEYDGYMSDSYAYPNGGTPPPEVIPAPQHMPRGLDDKDYGYTDDMGWHGYPNGTPDPGGNCWASFKC